MKFLSCFSNLILFFFCLNFSIQAQSNEEKTNKDFAVAKQSIINSEKRYNEAQKKVFRAKEKLKHYKASKKLTFTQLKEKENTLQKAEQKLKKMAQLIEHNKVLLTQLKTNPALGKSIKSNTKPKNKNQPKTIEDQILEQRRKQQNKNKDHLKKVIENKQKNSN